MPLLKEPLDKLIPSIVQQAHHARNQPLTVSPWLVEGLNQGIHKHPCTTKFPLFFPLWAVFLFTAVAPNCVHGAWFNTSWQYRVPVNIPAGTAVNSTIKVDVDFAALLTTLGASGIFDANSPRMVRPNDALSTNQQYTDTIYAGVTDASGNSRGEIRFILEDAGPATYYLYFDVTASGVKAANPQVPINGNFEFGAVGGASPQIPPGWLNATRSTNSLQAQIRPAETVTVTDRTTEATNGNPKTGLASYLQGFRSNSDVGGNVVLTKTVSIPASNPGNISISIRPEGWDSARNGNTTQYDYIQVRLLSGTTVRLNVVGPLLNNYTACPFSPNYNTNSTAITSTVPGYGLYNYWDNGSSSNNHTLGLSSTYNRGNELWITCSASLASVAGQTLTLEISTSYVLDYRSWFLIDDIEWSLTTATLGSPSTYSAASLPANFNCVETGATASTGHLYTKLVGTAFTFDVVALKSDGSVETNYVVGANKNVMVELVDGSGSTACASRAALSPTVSQTLAFASGNQGLKASAPMSVNNAYANLRCRVTDANQSPSVVACSTDNFAVRPTGFAVTSNINADASGTGTSATPTIKAGGNFTLSAASGVAGYNGTPQIDASKLSAHTGASQNGTLSGSFSAADPTTGTATGATFVYTEVGYFGLAPYGVYDAAFTAVDSAANDCGNDFSNALVGGQYGCKFGNLSATAYFGRFIPDHFAITQGSATAACVPSSPYTAFTYFGQDGFSTLFTLNAQNTANTTTQNYQGGFAKLDLTAWNGFNFSSASLPTGSALSASSTAPTGVWNLGLTNVVAKHRASRPTALTGETSVIVKAAPTDSDGVTTAATAVAPGTPLRYGRLNLQNAHGSELLPLSVSLTAQYWNGAAFVLNTDDSCTAISAPTSGSGLTFYPEVASGAQGNHLSSAETTATVSATGKLVSGDAQLKFSAPGSGNDGYFDLNIVAPDWLKFDWNAATAGDESPSGRVTFGIYKGNDSQIYLREVY